VFKSHFFLKKGKKVQIDSILSMLTTNTPQKRKEKKNADK